MQFQVRFAPSLAQKPRGAKPSASGAPPPKPFDPFEHPSPGLVVLPQLGAHHRLVLNKFAVSADHTILATTAWRRQQDLLEAADLAAAYACIEAYQAGGGESELFVFYNSGPHSGASQPHRHLQLLPVARMREGLDGVPGGDDAWSLLADGLVSAPSPSRFPCFVAATRLPVAVSPEALHAAYLELYRQACAAARGTAAEVVPQEDSGGHGTPARISYNLALTRCVMALVPRTAEGGAVEGVAGAQLSLNGTVLAGTALVKSAGEWEALQSDAAPLAHILEQIGVPWSQAAL